MKKSIFLFLLMLLMLNLSLNGAPRKLHFEKIGDEYIIWKQLDANRRVNGYIADKEIFAVLNYFDPSIPQDQLEEAYLNPEKNIKIRSDSCYTYNQKNFFLTKDKLYNDETAIYIPELRSITNDYNFEKTEGIIAWHMIIFYIGIFLAVTFFSLLINLVIKRWVVCGLALSALVFLSSFALPLLDLVSWDETMPYLCISAIALFFSGLLTSAGIAIEKESTTKNQKNTDRKSGKKISRLLFLTAASIFFFTAAIDFALITKLHVIVVYLLILGVVISGTIISALFFFIKNPHENR